MDTLISQYIDDELSLSEKKVFVKKIHGDKGYCENTIDMIDQEEIFTDTDAYPVPQIPLAGVKKSSVRRPFLVWGSLVAASVLLFTLVNIIPMIRSGDGLKSYRFVIYSPAAEKVELAGTFTQWNRIPMERGAIKGYWHVMISLSGGEHRFSYIIDGEEKVTDPTLLSREKDDFGGENSILRI